MSAQFPAARYYPRATCAPAGGVRQPSRRAFLTGGTAVGALALAGCGGSGPTPPPPTNTVPIQDVLRPVPASGSGRHPIFGADTMTRAAESLSLRVDAATLQSETFIGDQSTNGDEGRYADFRASFSKGLPHDDLGEVDARAFDALLGALGTGDTQDFEAVPLGGTRRLANPQAAYRFELVGLDSHKTFMRPAPEFESAETAAEMVELYWKSLCRDVPFADFGTSDLVRNAVADMNRMSATVGPKEGGDVTLDTVFRGETEGDLTGPYISQLLLKDVPYGNAKIEQRYDVPAAGDDYMTSYDDWLFVQQGGLSAPLRKGNCRYITDARALGEFVHIDYTYQAYLNAALILLGIPGSFDAGNIYNDTLSQSGFTTLGGPDVLDLVAKAGNLALSGAWYQKWLVHRRLRPEVYGARLHNQITGRKDYGLPPEIVESDAVAQVKANRGSYLLPQAFPEGSPTHPSYPAGHACIAGACATVLKAFFEEGMVLPDPVVPSRDGQRLDSYFGDTLTIGGEIDKLANNIALGRDWAGVHYRSDGTDGLRVGEQQAIGLLQDYSRTYREKFEGWTLTKFDGTRITIGGGRVV